MSSMCVCFSDSICCRPAGLPDPCGVHAPLGHVLPVQHPEPPAAGRGGLQEEGAQATQEQVTPPNPHSTTKLLTLI